MHYDQGDLVSETDMTVSASKLILNAIPYRVEGTGDISVSVDAEDPTSLSIGILFGMLSAYHQMEGKIRMHDTRPIVALLANQRGKYGWIEKLLTVEDIEGEAKLNIASGEVSIPYAFAGSDKIDVGAKGLMNAESREGIFLARYRKLTGILKVKDGERNFDIIGARKKFDAYVPGSTSAFAKDQK